MRIHGDRSFKVTNPADDRYIAVIAKRNQRATFEHVTSLVTFPIT